MTTAFLYDPRFLEHDTGSGHPERATRLSATIEHLRELDWFADLTQLAVGELAEEWIYTVHERDYVQRAQRACEGGSAFLDSPDVSVSSRSFEVARLGVAGALSVADSVMSGQANNGFALMRPPGHHAERGMALGFCLFNNIAITARYLQKRYGLERILILDWDVHHGNGTQHTFERDGSVFYVSLHQYPHYPGTGSYSESGEGPGQGLTLNCPMFAGARDADYEQAFRENILPALEAFKPDAVLLSAGFDAHVADPLGDVRLTENAYAWMTERMLEVADKHAGGRIISILEGGYNLNALPRCVETHLDRLRKSAG